MSANNFIKTSLFQKFQRSVAWSPCWNFIQDLKHEETKEPEKKNKLSISSTFVFQYVFFRRNFLKLILSNSSPFFLAEACNRGRPCLLELLHKPCQHSPGNHRVLSLSHASLQANNLDLRHPHFKFSKYLWAVCVA